MIRSVTITALSLAALLVPALSAQAEQEKVVTEASQSYGPHLSAQDGRTVYLFTADQGKTSACSGDCAKAWPPMMTTGAPLAGPGANPHLLGTIQRNDGTQVTYAGHPLYYFVRDKAPGETAGEGINHFGGSWYLVGPAGTAITEKKSSS